MDSRMKNLIEVSVDSIRIHMPTAFGDLGIAVKRIVVTRLADQVFYARLYVKQNGRDLDFDARPSDAIALAVRVECPIFVASEVMETAGIIPEADEIEGDKDKTEPVIDDERLAVFRDFVNSLDLPELPDEPGAKDEPGAQDRPGGRPGRG